MKIFNKDNNEINICHFQGHSLGENTSLIQDILNKNNIGTPPEDLSVISIWTDLEKCILKKQLNKHSISLINAAENVSVLYWYMPDKIKFYIEALEKCDSKYVLILDGYDVVISSFDGLIEKYKNIGKKILFNASVNNHPYTNIDYIRNRDGFGKMKYFNAGCCIGERDALLKFYKECSSYIRCVYNPWESEQLVMRYAFSKYSNKPNDFIGIDYNSIIFRTFMGSEIEKCGNDYIIY